MQPMGTAIYTARRMPAVLTITVRYSRSFLRPKTEGSSGGECRWLMFRNPETLAIFTEVRRSQAVRHLLQLRVLGFCFFQDGDVGIGAFPEREELLVGGKGPGARGIGFGSLRSARLLPVRTGHT